MTGLELAEELAAGQIRPGYLLSGVEPLLRDDALAAIESAVLGSGPRDFNLDRLETSSSTPGRLEEALASLPVLAERRLVVVRETEGRGAKLDESWTRVIEAGLSSADGPVAAVLVVMVHKVDRRTKWVKAFRDPAATIDCDPPKAGRALAAFVKNEAQAQSVEISPDAAGLLAERVGPQLLLLRKEIEKAALLAGPGVRIEHKHVEEAVTAVADEPIWDLTDAIGQGKTAEAVDLLARMLSHGAAAPAILGALASHFRKLVRIGHGESIAGHPFAIQKLERQARRVSSRRLVVCLRAIHRTDVELKGGSIMRPERALEQLVLALAN
ncbi:MAG: DNA polymerase III subunit delta [Myxococcota bacterium]